MKILVAIDSSISSHHALEQALKLLNLQNVNFLLLSVEEIVALQSNITSTDPLGMSAEIPFNLYEERELVQQEEKRTQSALEWAEHFCQQVGVKCTTRLEIGDPKHIICHVAEQEKPDLIVVGSEGRGVIERAILGSVSDYILHHTSYPVLVIHKDKTPAS